MQNNDNKKQSSWRVLQQAGGNVSNMEAETDLCKHLHPVQQETYLEQIFQYLFILRHLSKPGMSFRFRLIQVVG